LGAFKVFRMHQFHLKSQSCKEFILKLAIKINNQDLMNFITIEEFLFKDLRR
jgi:hypothetical protein